VTSDQATVGAFLLGALGLCGTAAVWLWPKVVRFFRALDRMFETINGRPAEIDKAQRQVRPAVPSLSVQLSDLRKAVADNTNLDDRMTHLEGRVDRLEEKAQLERITGHVAQAQAFKAIEEVARHGDIVDEPDTDL
jgi:hypothetical protein